MLGGQYWEFATISLYATDILILAFIASVFVPHIKACLKDRSKITNYHLPFTVYAILTALTLWSFASILWSPDKLVAFYQSLKLLEGIALFVALRQYHVSGSTYHGIAVGALVAGAIIQAALGSWQFLMQNIAANKWLGVAVHDPSQSGAFVIETELRRWLRAYGTLPHPNMLGEFLVVALLLGAGLIVMYGPRVRARAFQAESNVAFILWTLVGTLALWLPYAALLAGLFFTFSRAAWLVFFILLTVFTALTYRTFRNQEPPEHYLLTKLALLAVLVFVALGVIYSEPTTARLTGKGRLEVKSTTERVSGYTTAWDLFKKHPILGTGIGQSTLSRHPEPSASWRRRISNQDTSPTAAAAARSLEAAAPVHNTPVIVFVELGLVGGGLYLAFLASLIRAIRRVIQSHRQLLITNYPATAGPRLGGGQLPVTFALLAVVALTLFDHSFWTLHQTQMLFWSVAALATSIDRGEQLT